MSSKAVKLVVVGDVGVGKKSLIHSFQTKSPCSEDWNPGVMGDSQEGCVEIDRKLQDLLLQGISGQEDCDCLRPMVYKDAQVFLLCYSVDDGASFRNARFKWFQEVREHKSDVPVVLVACKCDLRSRYLEGDQRIVTRQEGESIANSLGVPYLETSSECLDGIDACFTHATKLALNKPRKKRLLNLPFFK